MEINENHQRVILSGLYMLEKSLERIKEGLATPDSERITYGLNDHLDGEARTIIIQHVEAISQIMRNIMHAFDVQSREESLAKKILAEASHIWEMLCDMRTSRLEKYGKTPKGFSDIWNPMLEDLIELTLRIHSLVEFELRKTKGQERQG